MAKRLEPIVIVEIPRYGAYSFVGEKNKRYAEANAERETECEHCGQVITKYSACYRDELYDYYHATTCIKTIQMGDLWAAYNEREVKKQ